MHRCSPRDVQDIGEIALDFTFDLMFSPFAEDDKQSSHPRPAGPLKPVSTRKFRLRTNCDGQSSMSFNEYVCVAWDKDNVAEMDAMVHTAFTGEHMINESTRHTCSLHSDLSHRCVRIADRRKLMSCAVCGMSRLHNVMHRFATFAKAVCGLPRVFLWLLHDGSVAAAFQHRRSHRGIEKTAQCSPRQLEQKKKRLRQFQRSRGRR